MELKYSTTKPSTIKALLLLKNQSFHKFQKHFGIIQEVVYLIDHNGQEKPKQEQKKLLLKAIIR